MNQACIESKNRNEGDFDFSMTIKCNATDSKNIITHKFGKLQWMPRPVSGIRIGELDYNNYGAIKIIFKMFKVLINSMHVPGYHILVRSRNEVWNNATGL